MAELNFSPCSSDHDEYPDPLEIAASAGARLCTPEKAGTSRRRETCAVQSIQMCPRGIDLRSSKISVQL